MEQDDLYGEDLYQGSQPQVEASPAEEHNVSNGANSTDATNRLAEQSAQIAQLQSQLKRAEEALQEWTGVFKGERQGIFSGVMGQIHPTTVINELRRVTASEQQCQQELASIRPREAALQAALCQNTQEAMDLRRQLQAAKQASDPSVVQLRQVLLDPAVNREVGRLKAEAESKARELKVAQEELQAVQFSQESKAGRMLMAKCRALQDENEEMGRELSEGRQSQLERSLVLAREQLEEMRRIYSELEDHAHALDDEAEQLQAQMLIMKRQLAQQVKPAGQQGAAGAGDALPPPPTERGFGRGRGTAFGRGRGFSQRGGFFAGRGGAGPESRKRMREGY